MKARKKHEQPVVDESAFLTITEPPYSEEAEKAVLGAILVEPVCMPIVSGLIAPDRFFRAKNGMIFEVMQSLFAKSRPIDLLTVREAIKDQGRLDEVESGLYLMELSSMMASSANVTFHCGIINQKWIARELSRIGVTVYRSAMDDTCDPLEVMEQLTSELTRVGLGAFKRQVQALPSIMADNINELRRRMEIRTGVTGIPTGFQKLDRLTSGWQPQSLVIVAARPAMGKTALALRFAIESAKHGNPVALFSLEMSSTELVFRMQSSESGIPGDKIRSGNIGEPELDQFIGTSVQMESMPIFIDDTPSLSIIEFRAKVARMVHEHGIKLIILDYLQLMRGDSGSGNREQEISSISRNLKAVAKEYNIPVIALSQLNRAVESRAMKVPMLSDLRESGAIEQDADMVIFPHRPEYYGDQVLSDGCTPSIGMAEIHVAKQRNGAIGSIVVGYHPFTTKFYCLDSPKPHQPTDKKFVPSTMYSTDDISGDFPF